MSDRCHWTFEGELAHFIPGCMGGAVGGPDGCTCDHPLSEIEKEREARRAASGERRKDTSRTCESKPSADWNSSRSLCVRISVCAPNSDA